MGSSYLFVPGFGFGDGNFRPGTPGFDTLLAAHHINQCSYRMKRGDEPRCETSSAELMFQSKNLLDSFDSV